jgi:hypothetical protein
MNAHFRLDLKALGENRKGLYKLITECPIACHNILDIGVEKAIDGRSHNGIPKIVERSLIFLKICG